MTLLALVWSTERMQAMAIRRVRPEDATECGRICYEAFRGINLKHGFEPHIPSPEVGARMLTGHFLDPGYYCIVAEDGGRILGSACMDERSKVAGIGPVTVNPDCQNRGVGRSLMRAALDRASERGFAGVRLVQAAFHGRALALYASLGFAAREPLSIMQGPAIRQPVQGCSVRAARAADLAVCSELCRSVHGHDRAGELAAAIRAGTARVIERQGRVTGYVTVMGFDGYLVGETNLDAQALIAEAESFPGPGILTPTRNAGLFRWCLDHGLRVIEPATLMSIGLYNEPSGAWLPSITY